MLPELHSACLQEMANDVFCIIEAMVGQGSELQLAVPSLDRAPQCIVGDPDRLRGILLNLYTNAGVLPRLAPAARANMSAKPAGSLTYACQPAAGSWQHTLSARASPLLRMPDDTAEVTQRVKPSPPRTKRAVAIPRVT